MYTTKIYCMFLNDQTGKALLMSVYIVLSLALARAANQNISWTAQASWGGTFDQLWLGLGECQRDCCKLMQCVSGGDANGLCWWLCNVGDGTESMLE